MHPHIRMESDASYALGRLGEAEDYEVLLVLVLQKVRCEELTHTVDVNSCVATTSDVSHISSWWASCNRQTELIFALSCHYKYGISIECQK
ncbi:hypothetical protein KIN20_002119 [Parelaphostrongylus tenuis]|uniref:Uncharacterized protein n=1 Tax=Parelaphostrongylus tenuis TaxID=148309 RepID=A0AAD5MN39_PARTN|nr:hypothetical protein KIN20_002119 [Parelaphostrongylus tenuis]